MPRGCGAVIDPCGIRGFLCKEHCLVLCDSGPKCAIFDGRSSDARILSAEDAVDKIRAGADVVQIYTGLIYKGPQLVKDSALAIKAYGHSPK